MKKSFSLLELIVVIFISSIVLIYSFKFAKQLQENQIENQNIAILKIDLNSTKIFLERHISNIDEKLDFRDNTLYFDNKILLINVTSFSITNSSNLKIIDITLNDKINQIWKLKQ